MRHSCVVSLSQYLCAACDTKYALYVASGYVELKNWKRLSTDDVTSDPSATVEEILGDVIAIATLRIRLSSRSAKLARVLIPHQL